MEFTTNINKSDCVTMAMMQYESNGTDKMDFATNIVLNLSFCQHYYCPMKHVDPMWTGFGALTSLQIQQFQSLP
uniref:Uncharacterized protein LOC103946439 n=1 Tax=Rhizophora mucronata TaxID=61149 RepID=A0A2P2J4L6_RHIMU